MFRQINPNATRQDYSNENPLPSRTGSQDRELSGGSNLKIALALDSLVLAELLLRWGVPPHATYLVQAHALVQDAAYGTLLCEPRRALHARIAETVEDQFPEIAESQPDPAFGVSLP